MRVMRVNIFKEYGFEDSEEALKKLERLLMRKNLTFADMNNVTRIAFLLGNASILESLVRLGYEDVAEEVALTHVDFPTKETQ